MPRDTSKGEASTPAEAAAPPSAPEQSPAQKEDAKAKPDDGKRTPTEWAKLLGHFTARDARLPQSADTFDWRHAAAAIQYGWDAHAYHHQGVPFRLSKADYEEALASLDKLPARDLHQPAIPDTQRERVMASFKKKEPHNRDADWKARGMKREEKR